MLRATYDFAMRSAEKRNAVAVLAFISFLESSIFPIPPDLLLIPMVLAARDRAWYLAFVCTAASVVGGFVGYAIGHFLFDSVGSWIIATYGLAAKYEQLKGHFAENGFWYIVAKGMTPIPYKIVTIASGALKFDLAEFGFASVLCRAPRFFLVAGLLWYFGPPIRVFVEKNLVWVTTGALLLVVAGFVVLKYL